MAQRVVFHIGLMKSGTTFIQGRLNTNRERLAEQQVLFPGPTWNRHVRAVSDLLQSQNRKPGSWNSLVDEIREHDGTAVVSGTDSSSGTAGPSSSCSSSCMIARSDCDGGSSSSTAAAMSAEMASTGRVASITR